MSQASGDGQASKPGCLGTTKSGAPCRAPPRPGSDWCYHHDPEVAEERREARRRGGKNSHRLDAPIPDVTVRSTEDVLRLVELAAQDILRERSSIARGRALGYLVSKALPALQAADLEERVAALETRLKLRRIS